MSSSTTSTPERTAVVVLAAGAGTRMRSATPKMLHRISGRTMLDLAITQACTGVDPEILVVVVGHLREAVIAHLAEIDATRAEGLTVLHAVQEEQNGTGHAVQCALDALPADFHGTIIVTSSDVPMLDAETLEGLERAHAENPRAAVTVLTSTAEDPTGYGRIIRNERGEVLAIVEQADATEEQRRITEVNSGVYAFDAATLRSALGELSSDNAQGELYLTDVISIARRQDRIVRGHRTEDAFAVAGVNDRVQLAAVSAELNRRICERLMRAGVTILDPATTWIDMDVTILGRDVTILPNTQLLGTTRIEAGAVIGPDTTLRDVSVGEAATVVRTDATDSVIGARTTVGPFSYLRPGSVVGNDAKIGTFVETKNVEIGTGSKVPHLTYVGDATIGEGSNIGASSVFVNYDGVKKSRTVIGDHVRTGSDTMFVAPVTVGDGAYSGAGTVIRDDVPPGALAVNTGRQRNLHEWVLRHRDGTPSADAARRALGSADTGADPDASSPTAPSPSEK